MKHRFTVSWTGESGASRLDFVEAEPDHNAIMLAAAQKVLDEYDEYEEDLPSPQEILDQTYETHCIFDGWIKESAVQSGGEFHVNDLRNFSHGAIGAVDRIKALATSNPEVQARLDALRDNLSHLDATLEQDYGLQIQERE